MKKISKFKMWNSLKPQTLEEKFAHRRAVLELACKHMRTIESLKLSAVSFEELLGFHKNLYELNEPGLKSYTKKCIGPKRQKSNIFRVTHYTDLAACLPPKVKVDLNDWLIRNSLAQVLKFLINGLSCQIYGPHERVELLIFSVRWQCLSIPRQLERITIEKIFVF